MASRYRLNSETLQTAARELGDGTKYKIHKRSGVEKSVVCRVINGDSEPSVDTLVRFSRTYQLTMEALIVDLGAAA